MFLCIEELTRHKAMKSASSINSCHQHIKSATDSHFVSRDCYIHESDGHDD